MWNPPCDVLEGPEGWPRKRLEWLLARLRQYLAASLASLGEAARETVLARFMLDPESIAVRIPEMVYRRREPAFVWQLNTAAVGARLQEFIWNELDAIDRGKDAERFPTLDAWLKAEAGGQLSAGAPEEWHAEDLLEPAAAAAFSRLRQARTRRWPRLCQCGAEFTGEMRSKTVRCEACLPAPATRKTPKARRPQGGE